MILNSIHNLYTIKYNYIVNEITYFLIYSDDLREHSFIGYMCYLQSRANMNISEINLLTILG
jgi:hypothetical protein